MNKGYIYLIFAALAYASMGALIKALSVDLEPFTQTFFRLLVSGFFTFLLVIFTKQSFLLKRKSDYLLMIFMGIIGYGLQIIFFTLALYHNTIGNTLFIFSAYPITTVFAASIFLKEKLTKRIIIALIIVLFGIFFLFDPTHITKYLLGNIFAFLGCLSFSVYIIISKILTKSGNSPETITLWSVSLAIITSGIVSMRYEHPTTHLSFQTIFFLILFGFCNFIGFNFVNKGFQKVKASTGTFILLFDPVIGTILGIVFFQEMLTPLFFLGAGSIIGAIMIANFL